MARDSAVEYNYVTFNKTDATEDYNSEFWLSKTNHACFHSFVDPRFYIGSKNHFSVYDLKVERNYLCAT